MKIIEKTTTFQTELPTAVGIGKFDGAHLGHRKLFDALTAYREKMRGRGQELLTAVFTFDPSPEAFFSGGRAKQLLTREEKRKVLEACGIDLLVEYPFNAKTASVPPEAFISEYLVRMLKARFIAAGADLSFGDKGKGNFALLADRAKQYGYEAAVIDKVEYEGRDISSTWIRELIEQGEMEEAAKRLGRNYLISGEIVHGRHLGSSLGFPTINILPPPEKCLPPFGVYYSRVTIEGAGYCGITNIGVRPTVDGGASQVSVETYLYDCSGDLYGKTADVEILAFRRAEQNWKDTAMLRSVVQADLQAGRDYFAGTNR